jgi:hypothetical protein
MMTDELRLPISRADIIQRRCRAFLLTVNIMIRFYDLPYIYPGTVYYFPTL